MTDVIRPRTKSEREALLVGYTMALEAITERGLEFARVELKALAESEDRLSSLGESDSSGDRS